MSPPSATVPRYDAFVVFVIDPLATRRNVAVADSAVLPVVSSWLVYVPTSVESIASVPLNQMGLVWAAIELKAHVPVRSACVKVPPVNS